MVSLLLGNLTAEAANNTQVGKSIIALYLGVGMQGNWPTSLHSGYYY